MNKRLRELQARKAKAVAAARAITDKATSEDRDLNEAETAEFAAATAAIRSADAAIDRERELAAAEASVGAVIAPDALITGGEDRAALDGKRGFKTFGEFAQSVKHASIDRNFADQRLAAAPTTYGNEAAGVDGGYAVPPEFAREIYTLSLGEDSLIPYTDETSVQGNSMVFPKDETTPWGTDGVRAYWQVEASAATQTKPKLSTTTLRLHKLMALVPLTDELLADTSALESYLPGKVADSIRWKANEAILWGLGNGTPLGVFNSNAVVSVAKDGSQTGKTVTIGNVTNMIARLPPGSFSRAVWLLNNDVLPSLFQMTLGNYPIYLPISAGAQGTPYGTLLGRPILVSQHAKTVGTVGDIMLADLSYYRTITKSGGMETATSMHLYFDADATAFRTTFRLDGQSKISAAITPANGSNNLSPFVTVAVRS